MSINEKVYFNLSCKYILDLDERYRYVNNRHMLFSIYDELYGFFEIDE